MPYTKTTWTDNVTPLSATNLNNLETQYDEAMNDIKNLPNTFTAKETFDGGFDLPSGQSGTVEGTLSAGPGGTIHATDSDELGGQPASNYLRTDAGAPTTQTVAKEIDFTNIRLSGTINLTASPANIATAFALNVAAGANQVLSLGSLYPFNQTPRLSIALMIGSDSGAIIGDSYCYCFVQPASTFKIISIDSTYNITIQNTSGSTLNTGYVYVRGVAV